jgi:hypothetical protein
MNTIKHYIAWFHQVREQYGILTAFMCMWYNGKHYNLDGSYKDTNNDRKSNTSSTWTDQCSK